MFLGIFTGIEVLFFMLGVLTTLSVGGLIWLKMNHPVRMNSLSVLGIGLVTIIAAIAWCVSSVLEGEPQAGSMGLMVIFLPGLVITTLGGRLAFQQMK
ncbi:hypothetical protein [Parendozoicomonas haliclonae]|uniref:Monovalent cation/H+ antiporter subunit G n=1 Tax=Parendozoicomonas haliclonae TaxID=1960125 RepID=A0A1X7AKZ5_9GAMM|nr:hypothetical protein [Parendozoicomonas haliclonae]SMA48428.1 hypothetical protein EHSB41UT_02736 [Parendozoicomonas haliclonae]